MKKRGRKGLIIVLKTVKNKGSLKVERRFQPSSYQIKQSIKKATYSSQLSSPPAVFDTAVVVVVIPLLSLR